MKELPNLADAMLMPPDIRRLEPRELATHAPRVLLLSVRFANVLSAVS